MAGVGTLERSPVSVVPRCEVEFVVLETDELGFCVPGRMAVMALVEIIAKNPFARWLTSSRLYHLESIGRTLPSRNPRCTVALRRTPCVISKSTLPQPR